MVCTKLDRKCTVSLVRYDNAENSSLLIHMYQLKYTNAVLVKRSLRTLSNSTTVMLLFKSVIKKNP